VVATARVCSGTHHRSKRRRRAVITALRLSVSAGPAKVRRRAEGIRPMSAADVVVQLEVIEHADGVYYLSCASPYGETSQRMQLPAQGTDLLLRLHQVETNVLRSGARIVTRGSAGRLEAPVRALGEELCDAVLQ